MRLRVLLPTSVLVDEPVTKVVAEAADGSFGLLPHHIDFVAALVPGLLAFTHEDDTEEVIAVDEGLLVKCGADVRVSVLDAARGGSPADLHRTVADRFKHLDEAQRTARSALARLEAGALRRFLELEEHVHGR